MKFFINGFVMMVLLGIMGCGKHDSEEGNSTINQQSERADGDRKKEQDNKPNTEQIVRNTILENELVANELSIGHFKEGDVLELTVSGVQSLPQFGDLYEKTFPSTWTEDMCFNLPGRACPGCPAIPIVPRTSFPPFGPDGPIITDIPTLPDFRPIGPHCMEVPKNGSCAFRYRDQKSDKKGPLIFVVPVKEISLLIQIGKNKYNLGEIVQNNVRSIVSRFKMSKEMLDESDEVILTIAKKNKGESVRVGFQGYGKCDGAGMRDFSSEGTTEFDFASDQPKFEYQVTAIVEYTQGKK